MSCGGVGGEGSGGGNRGGVGCQGFTSVHNTLLPRRRRTFLSKTACI